MIITYTTVCMDEHGQLWLITFFSYKRALKWARVQMQDTPGEALTTTTEIWRCTTPSKGEAEGICLVAWERQEDGTFKVVMGAEEQP